MYQISQKNVQENVNACGPIIIYTTKQIIYDNALTSDIFSVMCNVRKILLKWVFQNGQNYLFGIVMHWHVIDESIINTAIH